MIEWMMEGNDECRVMGMREYGYVHEDRYVGAGMVGVLLVGRVVKM